MLEVVIQIFALHLLFGLAAGLTWSQLPTHAAMISWVMLGLGYLLWRKLDQVHTAFAEERRAQRLELEGRWFWNWVAGLVALGAGLGMGGVGVQAGPRDGFWTELVNQPAGRLETMGQKIRDDIASLEGHGVKGQAELTGGWLRIEDLQRREIQLLEQMAAQFEPGAEGLKAQERLNTSLQTLEQTQRRLQETMDRMAKQLSKGDSR